MHQPVKDNLEDYLMGNDDPDIPREFTAHLASCPPCAEELRLIKQQADLLRVLRPGASVEARPGFYARVIDRIERQGSDSFWSVFMQPAFGRRLAMAAATLVLLLGAYFLSTEPGDHGLNPVPAISQDAAFSDAAVPSPDSLQRQRDAVLVNLATFHE